MLAADRAPTLQPIGCSLMGCDCETYIDAVPVTAEPIGQAGTSSDPRPTYVKLTFPSSHIACVRSLCLDRQSKPLALSLLPPLYWFTLYDYTKQVTVHTSPSNV